jgi:hypothetical protein
MRSAKGGHKRGRADVSIDVVGTGWAFSTMVRLPDVKRIGGPEGTG